MVCLGLIAEVTLQNILVDNKCTVISNRSIKASTPSVSCFPCIATELKTRP